APRLFALYVHLIALSSRLFFHRHCSHPSLHSFPTRRSSDLNLIHARPLVWTTSRPLVTELPFDRFTTGAMLFGSRFPGTGTLTYSLYGQFTDQFDAEPEPQAVDRSVGGRLEYASLGGWSVGGSYLSFTDAGRWRHLTGLDTLWQRGPLELMGELAVQEPTRGAGRQWGLYLQPVAEVLPKVYLVGRYEYF